MFDSFQSEEPEHLFFHEQRNATRHYRRVRKEPEDLPQALRYFKYANLNPRIAAFLGKQDPKSLIKRAVGGGKRDDDGKETADGGGQGDQLLFPGLLGQENRSLFPEIGGHGHNVAFMNEQETFGGVAEAEDPQRCMFEEATFSAPNILRELSDVLERFNVTFKQYVNRNTLFDPITGDPVPPDSNNPSIMLKPVIANMLAQDWNDVIIDTVYTTRNWQTAAYMSGYRAMTAPVTRPDTSPAQLAALNIGAENKFAPKGGDSKSISDLLEDMKSKNYVKKDGVETERMSRDSKQRKMLSREGKRDGKGAAQVAQSLTVISSVGTGANHRRSNMSVVTFDGENKPHRHHIGSTTLSFNLSSKKAFDEGWVVKNTQEPTIDQGNVLEWATSRLKTLIKQKEDEEVIARKRGHGKATLIRYYGDSRRDTLLKLYRKGNESDAKANAVAAGLIPGRKQSMAPKIPQLNKIDALKKEKFLVQLPDGSMTVYYPKSGHVAVMASAIPDFPGLLYINCYANSSQRQCLGSFTPYGKSCCYHDNGVPGLVLNEQGVMVKRDDGALESRFEWPKNGGKLKDNVTFNLNKEMYVRVTSKSNIVLHFNSNRETTKIQLGASNQISFDDMNNMNIPGNKRSSTTNMMYPSPRNRKGQHHYRKLPFAFKRQMTKKPTSELEELKHSLDPPERFEYESQADRELLRLQDKTKHLIEDWMEHYRVATGITAPTLKKLIDKPQVKSAKRNIQSAKERKTTTMVCDDEEYEVSDFQSFRSPSAPPKHMIRGPHSVSLKEDSERTPKKSQLKKSPTSETPHVRIESVSDDKKQKSPTSDKSPTTPVVFTKPAVSTPSTPLTGKAAAAANKRRPATQGQAVRSRSTTKPVAVRSSTSAAVLGDPSAAMEDEAPQPISTHCCPTVTRSRLQNADVKYPEDKVAKCRCSKHRIPTILDLEFDYFLRKVAPPTQIIVICVMNSLYPNASPNDKMFEKLYIDKNKNRSKPCTQSRHDQFRILRYDLANAVQNTGRKTPLLLGRHNAVPGMTLMYCEGRLLFADNIFNGYGITRNDFRKQVFRSRKEHLMGHCLPDDFRFTPGRGKLGKRNAWGGEMRGAGVDGKGDPGLYFGMQQPEAPSITVIDTSKPGSDITSVTTPSENRAPPTKTFDTARNFVQQSLSTKMYFLSPNARSNGGGKPFQRRSFPPVTSATPLTTVDESGALRSINNNNSYSRLQAVK